MQVVQDANAMYLIFMLMDHGFTPDEIDRTLRKLVGNDWREVQVSIWGKRLHEQGLIFREGSDFFIDDLVALVHGKIRLDNLYRFGRMVLGSRG